VPRSWSEAELVDQLRAGDERAFTEIVDRYHQQLIRVAAAFVSTPEAAEDAAQETWVALIKGIERFEGRSSLRSWLFQVCVNRARSIGTREHRTVPVEQIGPAVDAAAFTSAGAWTSPPAPWPIDISELRRDAATAERIRESIRRLPELQRTVVTLRDVDGLTAVEICRILSITASNQRVLLHRGREHIRRDLAKAVTR
jgi:RNA polymerase sigma-70 factor (ECF subfamily)